MTEFREVPDSERDKVRMLARGHTLTPINQALLAGGTVFVPGDEESARKVRNNADTLRRHGKRLVTRAHEIDGVRGVLAWAEERAE